jgi:bifunctional DNase/RNase
MIIEMVVTGLTLDPVTSTPIIILKDREGKNALTIWIGLMEASAIAMELEKIHMPRPMTHDLLTNILGHLKARVNGITVTDLRDNTFYAVISVSREGDVTEMLVDCRPSDAIAIALRTGAPIFVETAVIEKSRRVEQDKIETADTEEARKKKYAEMLEKMTPEDFGKYKH